MNFADLQSRVNAAASAKLLTDTATLNSVAITGKFDSAFANAQMMIGTNPTFTCLSADAGLDARNKTLIIQGVSYKVEEVKPDGTGFVLLELNLL